jgi:PhnB protein
MASRLNPYISFGDEAREAMTFYQQVFGGDLRISTFGEYGGPDEVKDKVMHAMLETPSGFTLMAADTPPGMERSEGSSITISLSGDDDAELRGYWDALSDGATVAMPLEKQMWGDVYGQLVDRFGVAWMVDIVSPDNQQS